MTAISDHCDTIRAWLNFDYSDTLVTSWTRMAEEMISEALRCKHMIALDVATVGQSRVRLPSDWLALDFTRVIDDRPLLYRSRNDFYSNPNADANHNEGYYTITGNYLIVGGDVSDGKEVELSYYESIPPLGDDTNWLMTYYSRLYVSATLSVASAYSMDDERAVVWQAAMQSFVDMINEGHAKSKASGSRVVMPRKKGFG